jgi:Mg-chelatase subunit ChlD
MGRLSTYCKETSGSVATMAAVAATCMIIGVGAAIDYNAMVSKRAYLQNTADSALLAAIVTGETKRKELEDIAKELIATSDYPKADATLTLTNRGTVTLQVSHPQPMFIMGAFGDKTRMVSASTEVPLPGQGKVNLALVLDTTESMDGSRMTALKSASADLITELKKSNEGGQPNVKLSLVPFADYVRISETFQGQTWLEVEPDHEATWDTLDEDNSINCREVGSGETAHTECDTYVYETRTEIQTWVGCMGSRKDGFHKTPAFGGRRMQGLAGHSSCGGSYNLLEPLTSDLTSIGTKVQALTPRGKTYMPAGLVWGWRTLDTDAPFTESASDDKSETKSVMLLMTDGSNTTALNGERDHFNGIYHWRDEDEDQKTQADSLTTELCSGIKADGIQIITIAYEVETESTRTLLKNCASTGSDYYNATSAAQLKTAFEKIGSSLNDVRLLR